MSSLSLVRSRALVENGFWHILKATECSFLYLYDKIWGGQLWYPTPNSGGTSPPSPPWSTPMARPLITMWHDKNVTWYDNIATFSLIPFLPVILLSSFIVLMCFSLYLAPSSYTQHHQLITVHSSLLTALCNLSLKLCLCHNNLS